MPDEPGAPPVEEGDDDLAKLDTDPARQEPVRGAAVHRARRRSSAGTCATTCATPSPRARRPISATRAASWAGPRDGALADNRYVTIAGQPERRYALYVEPRGRARAPDLLPSARHRHAPLRARRRHRRPRGPVGALDGSIAPLRRACPTRPRCVTITPRPRSRASSRSTAFGRSWRAAAASCAIAWASRSPSAPIRTSWWSSTYPGELKVYLSKDHFPSLADARHELDRMGLAPSTGEETQGRVRLRRAHARGAQERDHRQAVRQGVRLPAARGALQRQARGAGAPLHPTSFNEACDTLHIGARAKVPWAHVTAIGVPAPVAVGSDARSCSRARRRRSSGGRRCCWRC